MRESQARALNLVAGLPSLRSNNRFRRVDFAAVTAVAIVLFDCASALGRARSLEPDETCQT